METTVSEGRCWSLQAYTLNLKTYNTPLTLKTITLRRLVCANINIAM